MRANVLKPSWPFSLNKDSDQAEGLVGWWPGAAPGSYQHRDMSGYGNHGTLTGMALTQASGWSPGYQGGKGALTFDGTNDNVVCPTVLNTSGTKPFSFSIWVSRGAASAFYNRILSKESSANNGLALEVGTIGDPTLYLVRSSNSAGKFCSCAMTLIPLATWTHIAGTYDSATLVLYVNGISRSTASTTESATGNAAFTLGQIATGGTLQFPGSIEEPRLYNRALSASEIALQYRKPWDIRWQPGRKTFFGVTATGNRRRRILITSGNQ